MRKLIVSVIILSFVACNSKHPSFVEKESGLFFKLNTISDSERMPTQGDYLQVKLQAKKRNEQLLLNKRAIIKGIDFTVFGGLEEGISLMREGEEASLIFEAGKLSKINKSQLLKFVPDTALLFWEVQVDKIFSEEEFAAANKKFLEWVIATDKASFDVEKEEVEMDNYEQKHKLIMQKTPSGLRYKYLRNGSGESVEFGSSIEVKYDGFFLNDDLFNSTSLLENGVQDFYFGQELQVIKGIEEALTYMNQGDSVLLLIPSWLAFGEDGSASKIVKPNTPVAYHVVLKSVN